MLIADRPLNISTGPAKIDCKRFGLFLLGWQEQKYPKDLWEEACHGNLAALREVEMGLSGWLVRA